MPSSKHWSQPLPSSRKFAASTILFAALSIGGAVLINNQVLNPQTAVVSANTAAGGATKNVTKTATGDAINYMYGTVQLEITQTNGKITKITEIQATANNGREAAFPYLKKYALAANGTNFGNLGGATYTTDAYKQALSSAISKL